ncbi:MAG TPA: BON domain-containing protein [Longimicrobiales bacterium]|nr:BON domain-containing protein [Longimicrobiales bacterium]
MQKRKPSELAVRLGLAGVIAFGALASGFLISRRGRRFLRDVWQERRRSPLEDRVIDTIWGEPVLGRRPIDVAEVEPGVIAVIGQVRSPDERRAVLSIARKVKGVAEVEDRLEVLPRAR